MLEPTKRPLSGLTFPKILYIYQAEMEIAGSERGVKQPSRKKRRPSEDTGRNGGEGLWGRPNRGGKSKGTSRMGVECWKRGPFKYG